MRSTAFISIELNNKIHYTYVSNIFNIRNFIILISKYSFNKVNRIIMQYPKIQDIDLNGVKVLNVGNIGGVDVRVVDMVSDLRAVDYVFLFKETGIEYYLNNRGYERFINLTYKEIMNQYFWAEFTKDNIKQAKSKSLKSEYGFVSMFDAKKDAHINCEGHKVILVNALTNEYEVIDLCGVV